MTPSGALVREPAYVPPGFALRRTLAGPDAAGFAGQDDQRAAFYTRGWGDDDFLFSLVIHGCPAAGASLIGTEGHAGTQVKVGARDVDATYHDGIWATGPGPDQRRIGPLVIHWDAGTVHSLTLRMPDGVIAVRGPKTRGIPFGELIKVAESLIGNER